MKRITRKDLKQLVETFNSHYGLNLELYTAIASAIVYRNGFEIVQGCTLAETDRLLRAWVRGYIAGKANPKPIPALPVKLKVKKAKCRIGKDLVACGFTYGRKYAQARGTKFFAVKYGPGAMAKLKKLYGNRVLHIEKSFLQPESIVILKEASK